MGDKSFEDEELSEVKLDHTIVNDFEEMITGKDVQKESAIGVLKN